MTAPAQAFGERASFLRRYPAILPALVALAVIYAGLLALPSPPHPEGLGLDPSWVLGLNLAHAHGMVAGRDFVFTYGPLAYLNFADPVSNAPVLTFLYRIGLYLILLLALARFAWVLPSRAAVFWTTLLIGLCSAFDMQSQEDQVLFTLLVVAALAVADRAEWRRTELVVVAFLAALSLMVKLNQGVEGIAILTIVMVTPLISRPWPGARRDYLSLLIPFAVLIVSICVLYTAASGSLAALGSYLQHGWQVAEGYSKEMGRPGPLWQAALAALVAAGAFVGLPLVADDPRSLLAGFPAALSATFFVFKHSMVRQIGHGTFFHVRFAVALLFLLVCARAPRDRRLIVMLQLFSIAMGCSITKGPIPNFEIAERLDLQRSSQFFLDYVHWPRTWHRIDRRNRETRSQLRLPPPYHEIIGSGTVNAVPLEVQIVEANGWQWRPEPVFQYYNAWTPDLDRLNAEHLESGQAADFAIAGFGTIDGRHPFLEVPLCWRALLDRYDAKLLRSPLLLQRRPAPRFGAPAPISTTVAHWGQELRVPEVDGMLLMEAVIQPSFRGRLTAILFRTATVYMDVTLQSGKKGHWRCVWENLSSGFLIHPFPQNLDELGPLFQRDAPETPADRVVSLSLQTDAREQFAGRIPVRWQQLPLAAGAGEHSR